MVYERIPFLNMEETSRVLQGIDTDLFSHLKAEAAQACEYREKRKTQNLEQNQRFIDSLNEESLKMKERIESFLKKFSKMSKSRRNLKTVAESAELMMRLDHYKWILKLHEKMLRKSPNVVQKPKGPHSELKSFSEEELEFSLENANRNLTDSKKSCIKIKSKFKVKQLYLKNQVIKRANQNTQKK